MTTTLPDGPHADTSVVEQEGVYDGLPHGVYLADPVPGGSLSSSGARLLLPPNCPAIYRHRADNGWPSNGDFDLGHAAHLYTLGVGPELHIVDAEDWKTKAAREMRDAAYAADRVPLLRADHERVQDMAAALRSHHIAGPLFEPGSGKPEQSLFWVDRQAGVWCRARTDWLRRAASGRLIISDYKTTKSAEPSYLRRAMHDYGYFQQAPWYADGAQALGLDDDPTFIFVFQEKTPPYLITVVRPDPTAVQIGRRLNRQAIEIYHRCVTTGTWPGYSDDVETVALPPWVERRHNEETW